MNWDKRSDWQQRVWLWKFPGEGCKVLLHLYLPCPTPTAGSPLLFSASLPSVNCFLATTATWPVSLLPQIPYFGNSFLQCSGGAFPHPPQAQHKGHPFSEAHQTTFFQTGDARNWRSEKKVSG